MHSTERCDTLIWISSGKAPDIKQYSKDFGVMIVDIEVTYGDHSEFHAFPLYSQHLAQILWKNSQWDVPLMFLHLVRWGILARQLHYLLLHLWYFFPPAQGTSKYMWSFRQPVKMCLAQRKACLRVTRPHCGATFEEVLPSKAAVEEIGQLANMT